MRHATVQDGDPIAPTTESAAARDEAHRRRAQPDYLPGAALARERSQPVRLPEVDIETRMRWAGIPPKDMGIRFNRVDQGDDESFREWKRRAHLRAGFCVAEGFVEAYEWMDGWKPEHGSVYISGLVGRGKSLLVSAAAQRLLRQPVEMQWDFELHGYRRSAATAVLWADSSSLARKQRAHKRHAPRGAKSPMQQAAEVAVLVLDDFLRRPDGKQKSFEQRDEEDDLEWLVDARYGANLPVVITSNEPLESVEDSLGHRVASRLFEMCSGYDLVASGPDWRRS